MEKRKNRHENHVQLVARDVVHTGDVHPVYIIIVYIYVKLCLRHV